MSEAVDRAIERLTETAPALAQEVVRYTFISGLVEIAMGAAIICALVLVGAWIARKGKEDRYFASGVWILFGMAALLLGGGAIIALFEGLTSVLEPEGAAIVKALP